MSDSTEDFAAQFAASQKIWLESMTRVMQAAFSSAPNSTPPELLRQIRDGILQALAAAWNEFLRSPQFQATMRQWMDEAVALRKASNDFLAKARKEMQAPTSSDVDAIMLAVRHMETRVLDRVEELSRQVRELESRADHAPVSKARKVRAPKNPQPPPTKKVKTRKP